MNSRRCFPLLGLLALFLSATPAAAASCDERDVALAEEQRAATGRLTYGPGGPATTLIDFYESELMLAWAQHCSGRLERASYCRALDTYCSRMRGVIERERASSGTQLGTIQLYLRNKMIYGRPCQ